MEAMAPKWKVAFDGAKLNRSVKIPSKLALDNQFERQELDYTIYTRVIRITKLMINLSLNH